MTLPSLRTGAALLALFASYVAITKLGLALPFTDGVVSPVWAPAGIAIAALTLGGVRLWPAVWMAAFVANVTSGATIGLTVGIATGNTLEAIVAAALLHRFGFAPSLDRIRHVVILVPIALVSCAISAVAGVTLLLLGGHVTGAGYPERWLLWWTGDVMGVLVVAPFIFAVAARLGERRRPEPLRVTEFILMQAMIVVIEVMVLTEERMRFPALLIPFWVWSTVRFRALGSTTATLLVAVIGIGFAIGGTDVFAGATATQTVQILQALVAMVGLSALGIAASMSESDALRSRVEESLRVEQEAARDLRALDESKDRLLTAVSHELRTPLTSILALSDLVRDNHPDTEPAKLDEMLDRLTGEARRMDALLTDLLDLERLRLGLLEPRYGHVDVAALVCATLKRYAVDDRPMRLDAEPVKIDADAPKVERIVDNLLSNACKHSPRDACVTVSVRNVGDGALIAVEDEGPGVPDEQKGAVFELFNRGAALPSEVPGTGIGLSLVAHFTELHGGRAWVEDRDGGGSSFRVFLPGTRPRASA